MLSVFLFFFCSAIQFEKKRSETGNYREKSVIRDKNLIIKVKAEVETREKSESGNRKRKLNRKIVK